MQFKATAPYKIRSAVVYRGVLRYNPTGSTARWEPSRLQPGSPLIQPLPLFKKLDASIVAEERARLGK